MMRSAYSFLGAPVASLQEMLRVLSFTHPDIPTLLPTGRFGERTMEAVMVFQREAHLPVTGKVDLTTWNAIAAEYNRLSHSFAPPRAAALFPRRDTCVQEGQSSPLLYPIQGMFCGLSHVLENIHAVTPSGEFDKESAENTRYLQECSGHSPTGVLDCCTWETLCRLYETFLIRGRTDSRQKPTWRQAETE